VEQVVGAEGGYLLDRLALDLVGQEARARLADRASPAREPHAVDDPIVHAEHQRDPVATERVGAFVRSIGALDDPEVVGPPVVLEDVVAVQIVHARSSVTRTRNSDHISRIWVHAAGRSAPSRWPGRGWTRRGGR